MKRYRLFIVIMLISSGLWGQNPVDYVNPFIGTTNYGATNPGAVVPWGMVSVTPFNVAGPNNKLEKDSQWLSTPYEINNTRITGFSHVNLSGVGCPDLGSLLLMPTTGELITNHRDYGSEYELEKAEPGYYSTYLKRYGIEVELSSTERVGVSRYTFPAGKANILLNLGLGLTNESGGMVNVISDTEVEGFRMVGDFCYNSGGSRPVYFVMKLDQKASHAGVWKKNPILGNVENSWSRYSDKVRIYEDYRGSMAADSIGAYFSFDATGEQVVNVKLAVSYVSIKNARENMQEEVGNLNFDEIRAAASSKWNENLSRIRVEGGSESEKTMFYTALYHLLLHPNQIQDVNGQYPKMESYETLKTNGKRYTTFSLWDTYRNVHPLLSLVYPEVQSQMIQSMLDMYKESGWLPKWELLSKETLTMVGDPATPAIVDSYMRGIQDFDIRLAYEAMRKSATQLEGNKLRPGIKSYIEDGYLSVGQDGVWGSLSTTQEYNLSDWNLSILAKELSMESDQKLFYGRSMSYKKFYDPKLSILRPLIKGGQWHEPFDPSFGKNFEAVPGYVEGTAWQYTFFVPHDIPGLIKLYGGNKKFLAQLNKAFDDNEFSMQNEPDIAYPYLYNFIRGEEWRTQKQVKQCIKDYFSDQPDGLPGNDDTGTLSAWLIFSTMGFYPTCPGDTEYALTTPTFDKVTIQLNPRYYSGKEIVISKEGTGDYISGIQWNGKKLKSYFFDHNDMVKGGTLTISTTDR